MNIAIGEPIDFDEVTRAGCLVDDFPPGCVEDREDAAQVAAEYAHLQVSQLYADLVKDACAVDASSGEAYNHTCT